MSLGDLAAARAQTLRLVAVLTQPQVDFSPRQASWSIGEVLDHLLRAEYLYRSDIRTLIELKRAGRRPYLRRTFADVNVGPAFLPRPFLPMLEMPMTLMSAFIPDIIVDVLTEFPLVPIRNPDVATPQAGREAAELRGALAQSIGDTRELLEANRDLDLSQLVSEHPLTGSSNVPRILRFLAMHERRHHGQITRVLGHHLFPRAFG
ncbi:MAG: hypothetical protein A3H97_04370 [Acidobacteria bacterium RIFCSPLOWO2_02_FULL_65_29]|nr:MAG: hypothetical protein A3H97_04370 [Acidobacteria bacterium RIFCSPLOWO2_02_FULL_65_29]